MNLSIIIINYNTVEEVCDCIESILFNFRDNPPEIIIVDNNSTDGSVDVIRKKYSGNIKFIINSRNYGFGKANNIGALSASGDFLFLFNSDTVINENILLPINDFFKKNKNVGIISPTLILNDGSKQEGAYGRFPDFKSLFKRNTNNSSKAESKPFEVDWVSGAAMVIRRDVFDQINGFDEKFFMYFEDIDLCKRVKELGYSVMVLPDVSVTHLLGQSLKKGSIRKKFYYKSQNYYYKKHFGIFIMLLMRLLRYPYRLFVNLKG